MMYSECIYCKYYNNYKVIDSRTISIIPCPAVFKKRRTVTYYRKFNIWMCGSFITTNKPIG